MLMDFQKQIVDSPSGRSIALKIGDNFLETAFKNTQTLLDISTRLALLLSTIQDFEYPRVITIMGPLHSIITSASFFKAYVEYATNFPTVKYAVDKGARANDVFHAIIEESEAGVTVVSQKVEYLKEISNLSMVSGSQLPAGIPFKAFSDMTLLGSVVIAAATTSDIYYESGSASSTDSSIGPFKLLQMITFKRVAIVPHSLTLISGDNIDSIAALAVVKESESIVILLATFSKPRGEIFLQVKTVHLQGVSLLSGPGICLTLPTALAAVFVSPNEILLCFTNYGVYVDRKGQASRGKRSWLLWGAPCLSISQQHGLLFIVSQCTLQVMNLHNGCLEQLLLPSLKGFCHMAVTWKPGHLDLPMSSTPGGILHVAGWDAKGAWQAIEVINWVQ
ncbi:hypothetical protein DXG01_001722 [Tephrocybe rancida]|nr:hypothetical protein DXG01_001722 [Tephrocybe rancida]